jgi:hypothetical protein
MIEVRISTVEAWSPYEGVTAFCGEITVSVVLSPDVVALSIPTLRLQRPIRSSLMADLK